MIAPDKVQSEAKKRENENFKFRTYLKGHADKLKHGGKEYVYEKGTLWTGRY